MTPDTTTDAQRFFEAYRDAIGGDRPWREVREIERDMWATAAMLFLERSSK